MIAGNEVGFELYVRRIESVPTTTVVGGGMAKKERFFLPSLVSLAAVLPFPSCCFFLLLFRAGGFSRPVVVTFESL